MNAANIENSEQLVDTGGNFCMCNVLSMLVNVQPIQPFGISMAVTQQKTEPKCTHRGEFAIPLTDGSVFLYTDVLQPDCL